MRLLSRSYCLRTDDCWMAFQWILIFWLYSFQVNAGTNTTLLLNTAGEPPLNTETHEGFMDEVVHEAFKRIGYQLILEKLPAERGLLMANSGLIDGEVSRVKGIDKIYPNLVRVPEKIMDWEFVVFSNKPIKLQQGWDCLVNKDVAFITGWKILEKNVPKNAMITKTRTSQQLFAMLEKGRTDFIIYELWAGMYTIRQLQLDSISMRSPTLAVKEMFIYLHKKHKALVPKLAQALADMKKDGSYARLVKKHLDPLRKDN